MYASIFMIKGTHDTFWDTLAIEVGEKVNMVKIWIWSDPKINEFQTAGRHTLKEEGTMETSPLSSIRFIYGRTIRGRIGSTVLEIKYSLGRHDVLSNSREMEDWEKEYIRLSHLYTPTCGPLSRFIYLGNRAFLIGWWLDPRAVKIGDSRSWL